MNLIDNLLDGLRQENRLRTLPSHQEEGVIDFSSNDYLGLSKRHSEFIPEFLQKYPEISFSASASRLLATNQRHHIALEEFLGELYGKPALLFNSGYHANVGVIGALSKLNPLIVCDRLIHASVWDGLYASKADFRRFTHNDIVSLRKIIETEYPSGRQIIVVVESVYSMGGDTAPLLEIASLKTDFPNILLYVDEAHGFGVRGSKGLGLCEELNIIDKIDLIVTAFGKATASMGASAICSQDMKNLLINYSRSFIFSTALPPVNVAWSKFMIEKFLSMEEERNHLREISMFFNSEISLLQGEPTGSDSQIVPFVTHSAEKAIRTAEYLRHHNIIALPIRRPTVPPGEERLRFSLCAFMNRTMLKEVINLLKDCLV